MDTSQHVSTPSSQNGSSETKKITPAKHEKHVQHDFEQHVKEIRNQLNEQLKCLGDRTDTQISVLGELEEYFRRRGEVETEHSKQLEKLAKGFMQRHKTERSKREAWSQHAACTAWQQLVDDSKEEARERAALGELYSKTVTASISQRCDDLVRISKKCRDIGALSHSEINRVLTELHTAMKTYQICYSESSGVEKKLRLAEEEVRRYEDANKGRTEGRKHKNLMKYLTKRQEKYDGVRVKCTKARNEYLMCVRAANAALHRFFAQDLSYLIDCMDLGMEFWMRNLLDQIIEARKKITQKEMESLGEIDTLKSSLDSKADKQRFFEANHTTFMLPRQFEFRPQLGDSIVTVSAERSIATELAQRQRQIEKRLEGLRFESDEVWKSLEAAERQLFILYKEEVEEANKWRNDVLVTYQYYLKKFEYFLLNGNLIERLEARSKSIADALVGHVDIQKNGEVIVPSDERVYVKKRVVKRIGNHPEKPRPRLFGGSLEEYVEATGEPIPLLVTSAINFLSKYALRHQGLFRISGSQSDINRFKDAFERGEDAFAELLDGSEANSVSGALKLYLRELREPLFPIYLFEQFTDCAKADNSVEFINKTRDLIMKLPVCSIMLLRFLFGFLSHLCEFSDENMMEPHSLAICFGPTLLPIPEGKDQVFYHNFVNELVRALIVHHESVFPTEDELEGPMYNKYMIEQHHMGYVDDNDVLSSGDEDCLPNGHSLHHTQSANESSAHIMVDSMGEISCSTMDREEPYRDLAFRDVFRELSSIQRGGTPTEPSQPPSLSSRSSNRSTNLDSYLRRMSEDSVPTMPSKSESPNYVNHPTVYEQSSSAASSHAIGPSPSSAYSPAPSSISIGYGSSLGPAPSAIGPAPSLLSRPHVMSLRDQLIHMKKDENGLNGGNKVYPAAVRVQRMSLTDVVNESNSAPSSNGNHPDSGGSTRSLVQNRSQPSSARKELGDLKTRLAMQSPIACDLRDELKKVLQDQEENLRRVSEQPDIVREHVVSSARAQSEMTKRVSPPFDELEKALQAMQDVTTREIR